MYWMGEAVDDIYYGSDVSVALAGSPDTAVVLCFSISVAMWKEAETEYV